MGQTVELMERITVNPDQCGGRPCIRGMRIRVIDVLDLLAAGLTPARSLKSSLTSSSTMSLRASVSRAVALDHPILAA